MLEIGGEQEQRTVLRRHHNLIGVLGRKSGNRRSYDACLIPGIVKINGICAGTSLHITEADSGPAWTRLPRTTDKQDFPPDDP